MKVKIDSSSSTPRIDGDYGTLEYSEQSNKLFIKSRRRGVIQIGSDSTVSTETDPIFTAWLAIPPNVSTFTNDSGYLTFFSETDPIFSLWQSTYDNHADWDTAYGWGNHASAGYLTGITSGDVTTALGYTPVTNARNLTINGVTYDLSADRTWTISGSGVSALSAIGSTPNANSATITGSTLNLEPASASFGGVVTTGTQTFAGRKIFNGYITIAGGTATAGTSPLKFTSGTNLTIAEEGVMEYNGSSLFFTRSGTLRAGLLMTDIASPFNTYDKASKGATVFTTGTWNTLIGSGAGNGLTTGTSNVYIGFQAGSGNVSTSDVVSIGYQAGYGATSASSSNFFGAGAGKNSINSNDSNFFGYLSGLNSANSPGSNFFGWRTGGYSNGYSNHLGYGAGSFSSTSGYTNFLGQYAGYQAVGSSNSNFFGYQAGRGVTSASNSNFFGQNAGFGATGASDCIAIGTSAGRATSGAIESIFIGKNTGYNTAGVLSGDYNIAIGSTTFRTTTTGSKNVAIGYNINIQTITGDGQLTIQNAIFGTGNTGTGTTASTGNIGIYTPAPSARLHLPAGTATANTAPLKLTSGTNLTTPENGALEYDGTNLYFTTGGVRKTIQLI